MIRRTLQLQCFAADMAQLKMKYRGKAQYGDAQTAALTYYREQIPTGGDLKGWLDEDRVTAALNGAQFFEISFQQLPMICEYAREHLGSFSMRNKLMCGIALCHSQKGPGPGGEVGMDHKSFVKMDIIPQLLEGISSLETSVLQNVAKLMQRSGCTDEKYWGALCDEIVDRRLEDYRAMKPFQKDAHLIRIVAGTARFCPEHRINGLIIDDLVGSLHQLKSFDFSSLCATVQRLHQKAPQSPRLLEKLLRRASSGASQFTCRDLSAILKSLVKIKMDMLASGQEMTNQVRIELAFKTAVHSLEGHVGRFVDKAHHKYWSNPADVVTVFFSLEAADGLKTGAAMGNFAKYIAEHSSKLTAFETAVATGVLRRTGNLNEPVLSMLAARAAQLVEDFSIDELAHVGSTFATRKNSEQWPWLSILEERISSILNERTGAVTRLYLTAAFPDHQLLPVDSIELSEVPPRQAIDCLSLVKKGSPLWIAIVGELNRKFETDAVFSATDVRRCSMIDFDGAIHKQAQAFMVRRLEDEHWRHDTIKLLCLVKDASVREGFLGTAVEQAERIFIPASPLQLYHAVSKLVDAYGTKSLPLRDFIKGAGDRLVQGKGPSSTFALMQFVGLATRHRELMPDAEWVEYFIFTPISQRISRMSCADITRVLELLEAHKVPTDKKFMEPVEVMVARGIEHAATRTNDEMNAAILLATAMRLKCGATLPKDAINSALTLSWLPEEIRADLRGEERPAKRDDSGLPKRGSRFSRSVQPVADGSAGSVSVTTVTEDPLHATLEDTPAATDAAAEDSVAAAEESGQSVAAVEVEEDAEVEEEPKKKKAAAKGKKAAASSQDKKKKAPAAAKKTVAKAAAKTTKPAKGGAAAKKKAKK